MPYPLRRIALISTGLATVTGSLVLTPLPVAYASSSSAVISEVYGGGGNSGATLTRDFVELANRSTSAYTLDGYSVQYLPASPSAGSQWQVTRLTGSLAAGGTYLVSEAAGSGGTTALPAADASGSISMAAASGTVALVKSATALTCKTVADCAADPNVVDLVGYGTAVVREGTAAPTASNTTSVSRAASLTDTDDNSADFTAGTPTPTNSAGETAGGSGGGTSGPAEPGAFRIHDIQGTTRISPLKGQMVTGVPGIVTAVRTTGSKGYWIQDPNPDANDATSEGLFVYTSSAPTVSVGDSVLVTGKVSEYYPSSTTQSVTELTSPVSTTLSTGNALPDAVVLDADSIPDAYSPTADGGSIESLALQPTTYSQDFYESIEGMRAEVSDARVVGATNSFGELFVTAKPDEHPTLRGGTVYGAYDQQNTGRIEITTVDGTDAPTLDVGDELSGTTTGPVDYSSFGGYLLATSAEGLGTAVDNGLQREVTRKQTEEELAVATYNVENLDPSDSDEKFARLAEGIADNLNSPDIVALEEIQDNDGATDDGVVASDQTVQKFVDAIAAAGGPTYSWRSIDPQNDTDGGEPGGNIRQVFLYNPERVTFVDRAGGDATTAVSAVKTKHGVELSASPGRIDPTSDAWDSSRKPLAGEFKFRGESVFVVANHFNSKGGDQPLHGRYQEPTRSSETQRKAQAAEVNSFVDSLLAADSAAQIVVLGDLNDFEFSPAVKTLTDDGKVLTDLLNTLPADERYTYVYDGNSQSLDHILTSPAIKSYDYDVVHINAEFADQASDHDPQIVRFDVKSYKK
ncbi:endonuclease/exonuclease/phosphatase family protein [Streptomyces sp. NPDC002896]|uniref:endonuclease/exonuclease/phosphatase family protein n=1 Tax=Streptomyces sp. NPDC002896 TaxID=3154438 RepID=UPI0033249D36